MIDCSEYIDETVKIEFGKICRCCLLENTIMKSIYDEDLSVMLMACATINITINDGLPSLVCTDCQTQIKQSYLFRQQCERSDTTLRECFESQHITDPSDLNLTLNADILNESGNHLNQYELVLVQYENGENSAMTIPSENDLNLISDQPVENCTEDNLDNDLALKSTIDLHDDDSDDVQFINEEYIEIFRIETIADDTQHNSDMICNDVVPLNEDLTVSEIDNSVPSDEEIMCKICNKQFGDKHKLNRHKKQHLTERPFECNFCDKSFVERGCLKKHLKRHRGEKPFGCGVCGMKFYDKSSLVSHTRIHTGDKPFICQFENCGKAFTQSSQLETHKKIHRTAKENVCDICDKRFTLSYQLKVHKRTHSNEKPYECNYCGKSFSQSGNLTTHIRTHTGDKPFSCTFNSCERSFASVGELNSHLRKHTGQKLEKKLACRECGKMCRSRCELQNHLNTHAGVKPYQCTVCDKSFLMSSHVVVHMRSHTGERPYQCSYCPKAFTTQQMMTAHLRIHTGEKKYACDICDKKFTQGSARNKHRKTHSRVWTNQKNVESS